MGTVVEEPAHYLKSSRVLWGAAALTIAARPWPGGCRSGARVYYTAQTLDQLRNLTPLRTDRPPGTVQLFIPNGDQADTNLDVSFYRFNELMTNAINLYYVQDPAAETPPGTLDGRPPSVGIFNMRILFFIQLLGPAMLWPQVDRTAITGTVTDQQGNRVPQSRVRASESATGFQRETLTTSQGTYELPGRLPCTLSCFSKTDSRPLRRSMSNSWSGRPGC
jgi:hypothetical protein